MVNYKSENTNYNDIRRLIDEQIKTIENNSQDVTQKSFYKKLIAKVKNKF